MATQDNPIPPFADLVALELGDPQSEQPDTKPNPDEVTWLKKPERNHFGIAFSGGGIRSATFNLGLLQGLQRLGLLKHFDYISTVSGGGYIGSFWTAWRYRRFQEREDVEQEMEEVKKQIEKELGALKQTQPEQNPEAVKEETQPQPEQSPKAVKEEKKPSAQDEEVVEPSEPDFESIKQQFEEAKQDYDTVSKKNMIIRIFTRKPFKATDADTMKAVGQDVKNKILALIKEMHKEFEAFKKRDAVFPARETHGTEPSSIRHLREFSNFLSPRLGLFSVDTGRLIVGALGAVIPALLTTLSLLIITLFGGLSLAWLLLGGSTINLDQDWLLDLLAWLLPIGTEVRLNADWGLSVLVFAAFTAIVLVIFELIWRKREKLTFIQRRLPWQDAKKEEVLGQHYYSLAFLIWFLAVGIWAILPAINAVDFDPIDLSESLYRGNAFLPTWSGPSALPFWRLPYAEYYSGASAPSYALLGPSLAWAGAALLMFLIYWAGAALLMLLIRSPVSRIWSLSRLALRSAFNRATSRLLYLAAVWGVFAGLWTLGDYAFTTLTTEGVAGLIGTTGIFGGLFAWAQKAVSSQFSASKSSGLIAQLKPLMPQILAYLTIAFLILLMIFLVLKLFPKFDWWIIPAVTVGITALTLFAFDPNRIGLHAFYKSRLARAYLGASNFNQTESSKQPINSSEEQLEDDIALDKLAVVPKPVHLICCAANDLAPANPLPNLYRGAKSAVLSGHAFSVGNQWASWAKINDNKIEPPSLAAAITASGAAFNSHMGSLSMQLGPAVTFLMTAFNVRLGLWLNHPVIGTAMKPSTSRLDSFLKRLSRFFIGIPFYKELFGRSRADSASVFLSDGGHFDNMALYELIRRHCKYIIACDCGADPNYAFDDFGNALRRIRADFGVEIKIDLSPLRPDEEKPASQYLAVGDIIYPDTEPKDYGVLLFFKPTLIGKEPPDIAQYKNRNPAFPQETTGDQFYDEAQWESYRRLGEHAAMKTFMPIVNDIKQFEMREQLSLMATGRGRKLFTTAKTRYWKEKKNGDETEGAKPE